MENIFSAVKDVFWRVSGGYSVLAIIAGKGLLCFRDPYGIRPLIMGRHEATGSYAIASESTPLDMLGYRRKEDIPPGGAVFIDLEGNVHSKRLVEREPYPCIFEYVYFARPDSFIDGISVYETRIRLGKALIPSLSDLDIDVVIPVPDSARPAAIAIARECDIPYREGLVKNRHIGRTFIMPSDGERQKSIRRKLNVIRMEFNEKKVLIVDDSIVRGNTSREIVRIARESGADKVYFASCSPPLKHPCVYGIDMSTKGEFLASNRTIDEIEEFIGADGVIYLQLESMVEAVNDGKQTNRHFCTGCFTGDYPTPVTEEMMREIENDRLCSRRC